MQKKSTKEIIDILAKMLTDANKQVENSGAEVNIFGKCTWVDIDNNDRCNDHWSEFQCEQVSGTFYPGETCDDGN